MPRLLPRLVEEPPAGYVAFVDRHLETLRHDAARVVGTRRCADELYPEVLTDVAARWEWLELLRRRLGRAGAADSYLRQAFDRQSQRWLAEQAEDGTGLEIAVIAERPVEDDTGTVDDARARWGDEARADGPWADEARTRGAVRSSAAVRLAPHVRAERGGRVGPVAEAAIAWLHAYAARRRRRLVAGFVAALLLVAWLAGIYRDLG